MGESSVNNIIVEYTSYRGGRYRHYPTHSELQRLIQEIIKSELTSDYIKITPFYVNSKLDQQVEFDDYMFYMECREQFNETTVTNHISACIGKDYGDMSSEEISKGYLLFPLCKYEDGLTFKKSLEEYLEYLDGILPKLLDYCKLTIGLSDDDLAFGYFCFEIHSG
ncbi:hypothetical protein ACE41H_18930 [Paenibacillus enshidis]|uniref:Uncharacterized protein n=1 Tax=Paenibacillus enshidis TaxID=1458439 RepID=A0ABV5B0F2_9BACL